MSVGNFHVLLKRNQKNPLNLKYDNSDGENSVFRIEHGINMPLRGLGACLNREVVFY